MKKHFRSLKSQLFVIFSAFVLLSLLAAGFTANYYREKEQIEQVSQEFVELETLLLKAFKEQENFFNFETVNEPFFIHGRSPFIREYKHHHVKIQQKLRKLTDSPLLSDESTKSIHQIKGSIQTFDSLFSEIIVAIKHRGFKNQGLEGEMRNLVHQLEKANFLTIEEVLSLRRHEKDFILRQDSIYIQKHKKLVKNSLNRLRQTPQNMSLKNEIELLEDYATLFQELAQYEQYIGIKSNSGLKNALNKEVFAIQELFEKSKKQAYAYQEGLGKQLQLSLLTFWTAFIIIGLLLCYHLANRLSKRITSLSRHINYFVNTNFTARMKMPLQKKEDEVGLLWNNVLKMETEIIDYLELFKEKVNEKTLKIELQKEKLQKQKQLLQHKNAESEQQNKDLLAGIKYAWRIQQALLPNEATFQKQIEKGFVFFLPKDIVSGDIYFTKRTKTKKGKESIFSVIDCTGHGVPGAFMSVLATQAIDDAITHKKCKEPADILQQANNYIYAALKYYNNRFDESETKDGMDLAIGKLNRKEGKLYYATANRPIYLVRSKNKSKPNIELEKYRCLEGHNEMLYELLPQKFTLGTLNTLNSKLIRGEVIDVYDGDMIYLSTDGYADQFGGKKGKKFMTKKLKELLIKIQSLPEENQQQILDENFSEWKGKCEQVDDVCLMGVRV